MDYKIASNYLRRCRGSIPMAMEEISVMKEGRQEDLRRAEIGARPGMAQVPIEFETDLYVGNFVK